MSELSKALTSIALGIPQPTLWISWGVRHTSQVLQWLEVNGAGEVWIRQTKNTQESKSQLGSIPPATLCDFSALALGLLGQDHNLQRDEPDIFIVIQTPEQQYTIQLNEQDIAEVPSLEHLQNAFLTIKNVATLQSNDKKAERASKIEVYPSRVFWITTILGGVLSFGLLTIIMLFSLRNMPRFIDRTGITLRNGKHYRWGVLHANPRFSSHRPMTILGYDLVSEDGQLIRLAPSGMENGEKIIESALSYIRMSRQRGH